MPKFKIKAEYKPDGDQPNAIKELVTGIDKGLKLKAVSFVSFKNVIQNGLLMWSQFDRL